jgi:hypothetical protein
MPRLSYALPSDVLRRVDPTATTSDLMDTNVFGAQDRETLRSRLEGVESKWDRHATPMRPVPVGSRETPKYHSAKGGGYPVHIYLEHQHIHPIDASMGDLIERRTGRGSWTDITTQEGSAWTADYEMGRLTVYKLPGAGALPALRDYRDRFLRVSYHLAAGGDYSRAGQTTIDGDVSMGTDGTLSVAHASRLPRSGGTMLLGGSEYVHVDSVDHETDEIEIATRGVRRSEKAAHGSEPVIHYCPMDVREAVAAKAAREFVIVDDLTEWLFDDPNIDLETKLEEWEAEWQEAVGGYSDNAGYD